ncbi:MAG TPA: Rieske (2Fe-2S) protein [Solirubrobacterales bacterium]|nr:Rieske (2Fe-2S) protein [Solirubrobacterales bacterium]
MTPGGIFSRVVAALGGLSGLRRRREQQDRQSELHQLDHPADSQVDAVRSEEELRRREYVPPPELDETPDPRAELVVALLLVVAAVAFAGFVVFYVISEDTQLLGLCIGLGLVLAGVASALAGKRVVIQEKATEKYKDYGDREERRAVENHLVEGKVGVTRRKLLFSSLAAVGAALGAAAVVPIASLGPRIGEKVYETPWSTGKKVVDETGEPITLDTLAPGEFITGFPAGASKEDLGSPLMLVRLEPDELELPADRAHSAPHGYVAYSKICTHAGCAVSLFRYPTFDETQPGPALVCPCHYSTFNPADGGKVLFGPAGRPLPQLPLRVGADGGLEAAGGFYEPIGPSYGGIREDPRGKPL